MANKQTLTREEIQRIKSLEVHTYNIGGKTRSGYFDPETLRFYIMDERGELTGEVGQGSPRKAKVPTPDILKSGDDEEDVQEEGKAEQEEPAPSKKGRGKKERAEATSEQDDEEKAAKMKKAKTVCIIVAVVGCLVALAVLFLPNIMAMMSPAAQTGPTITASEPSTIRTANSQVPGVVVLSAATDMYKGDILTSDKLNYDTITNAEYNQLIAQGLYPCQRTDESLVDGLYVSTFIGQGQYIVDSSLSPENPIDKNPWEENDGMFKFVTVPVSDIDSNTSVSLGMLGILDVTQNITLLDEDGEPIEEAETAENEAPVDGEEYYEEEYSEDDSAEEEVLYDDEGNPIEQSEEESAAETEEIEAGVDGLTASEVVSQRVKVRNYTVDRAVVVDLLNSEGNSIYPYIAQYLDLPGIKQKSLLVDLRQSEEFNKVTNVEYVVIAIRADQAEAIGNLDECEISMTTVDEFDTSTPEKATLAEQFYSFMTQFAKSASSHADSEKTDANVETADEELVPVGGDNQEGQEESVSNTDAENVESKTEATAEDAANEEPAAEEAAPEE